MTVTCTKTETVYHVTLLSSFLFSAYSILFLLSIWFIPHTLQFFTVKINAGILPFLISLVCLAIINKIYGSQHIKKITIVGFLFAAFFIIVGYFITFLPSPSYLINNKLFDAFLLNNKYLFFQGLAGFAVITLLYDLLITRKKIISFNNMQNETAYNILLIAFSVAIISANWFDVRHVEIFGFSTGGGSLTFPFTFLIADVITEVYGYSKARKAIWMGLFFYLLFVLYGQFVLHFSISDNSSLFNSLSMFLHLNHRIILASIASYLITEILNAYIVAKLKSKLNGKYMGLRFLFATLMAHFINELVYAPIAFQNLIPDMKYFINHIVGSWIIMVCLELLFLPFFIRFAKILKNSNTSNINQPMTLYI